jgi:hypothetical protein
MAWTPGVVRAHFINELAQSGGLSSGSWTCVVAELVIAYLHSSILADLFIFGPRRNLA